MSNERADSRANGRWTVIALACCAVWLLLQNSLLLVWLSSQHLSPLAWLSSRDLSPLAWLSSQDLSPLFVVARAIVRVSMRLAAELWMLPVAVMLGVALALGGERRSQSDVREVSHVR